MRVFALIGLVGIVGGPVAAWLVKRRRPRLAETIRLSAMIFTQGVVAVILGSVTVQLAQDDELLGDDLLRLALAVLVGLLALVSAALGGFYVWAWRKVGLGEEP